MVAAYRTRWFGRWAEREGVTDHQLVRAIDEIESGLVDAWLGGDVVKKRIGAPGRGKRGAWRVLLAWRPGRCAVFVYGFAKNERGNISAKELKAVRMLAAELLAYDGGALRAAVAAGELSRLMNDGEQDP
jgi:hypothetical protein